MLRMGWYRPVHRKSVPSQEVRALLAARKQMQIKAMDLEQTPTGRLRGFGVKVGDVSRGKLAACIRELVSGHTMLERIWRTGRSSSVARIRPGRPRHKAQERAVWSGANAAPIPRGPVAGTRRW